MKMIFYLHREIRVQIDPVTFSTGFWEAQQYRLLRCHTPWHV